jgi:signal transduction histidine kinase
MAERARRWSAGLQRSSFSLRFKFTLWSLLVFLSVYLAGAGLWVAWTRARIVRDHDARFAQAVDEASRRLESESRDAADPELVRELRDELLESTSLPRSLVAVWGGEGGVLARAPLLGPLADLQIPAPTAGPPELALRAADGSTTYLRGAWAALGSGAVPRAWLLYAAEPPGPLAEGRALQLVAIGALIGIAAAAAMAWIMGGRIVRPIQRMANAARSVSPANLRGRIDVEPIDAEMARLQQDLNDALERLERGYRAQGQFLSNVSHELKTPVAVLLSQAQVLRRGGDADEMAQFAGNVEEEMRTLARLVESLLLLARVEHGKDLVRRVGVPVNDLVLEAAERTSELARSLDVPLVTNLHLGRGGEGQPEVVGDPELLRTMIENLVRNALRFTPSGEPVDLRVDCRQGEASIRVRDRGPGVPKEHLERIFERFYQVPGERGAQRGTGLGLAIARSVAELHKGRIAVRNLPGEKGCEFEVRLPLSRPEPAHTGQGARPRGAPGSQAVRRAAS